MVARGHIARGEVYLVELEPVRGKEIRKTRPCLIVSPEELNALWQTVTVAPLTTGSHAYPFRVACRFDDQQGHIVLDQIRSVDRGRLKRKLGKISPAALTKSLAILQEMFAA